MASLQDIRRRIRSVKKHPAGNKGHEDDFRRKIAENAGATVIHTAFCNRLA